eukprot:g38340.t1
MKTRGVSWGVREVFNFTSKEWDFSSTRFDLVLKWLRDLVKSFDLVDICLNLHPDSIAITFVRPELWRENISGDGIVGSMAATVGAKQCQQEVQC